MTYLLIITYAPSPIPSQIPHTLFDIISFGEDAVVCHEQESKGVYLTMESEIEKRSSRKRESDNDSHNLRNIY